MSKAKDQYIVSTDLQLRETKEALDRILVLWRLQTENAKMTLSEVLRTLICEGVERYEPTDEELEAERSRKRSKRPGPKRTRLAVVNGRAAYVDEADLELAGSTGAPGEQLTIFDAMKPGELIPFPRGSHDAGGIEAGPPRRDNGLVDQDPKHSRARRRAPLNSTG